jgi:two-component system, NtrC family, response regulator AtoC
MAGETQTNRTGSIDRDLPPEEILFGSSAAMRAVQQTIRKVAGTSVPVLIQGDGGTGKEMLARWVHKQSACAHGQFVKVSCAAIPTQLLESELFGYEKGAFTGANQSKPGRVEWADKGTLFLDDISELELRLQGKLLHFLQDGVFCRIGDDSERRVDTRVICASSKDLQQMIRSGEFRADLFYRINVVQLRLPRLRERREDIPCLAEYFRIQHERQMKKQCEPFRTEILDYYKTLHWQGNLRELSNQVARYVLIGPDSFVGPPYLPLSQKVLAKIPGVDVSLPLKRITKEAVRKIERDVILQALRENQWNRRKTAEALQISYRSLIYKIREAGLSTRSETF